MKIYNYFWDTVKRLGNVTVFVHRKFCRMKNYPSVIDIITYRGEGVNKEVVKAIVDKINNKYRRFFKSIKKNYKFNIIFEQHRIIDRIKEVFGEFSLDKVKIEYKTNIMKDLEVIKKYAEKEKIKRLEKEFNKKNFIAAIKSATKSREIPRVTVDSIFTGEPAITKKRPMFLKDHIVMEVECNSFMNYWYPKQTSDILIELLDNLVSVDMYKREGIKQMQIIKYLKIPESSDH